MTTLIGVVPDGEWALGSLHPHVAVRRKVVAMDPRTHCRPVNLGFCPEQFAAGVHICLVFRDERTRRSIVAKYIDSGLTAGEKVFYFADTAEPDDVVDWLATLDVEIPTAGANQAFTIAPAVATYCPDGRFDNPRMCATVAQAYCDACAAGYDNSRVSGEMSWALRGFPGSDQLMAYESAVNAVLQRHPITAMCQYDANRFSGSMIFQALQVHPYLVVDNQVVRNPYYRQAS